MIDVSVRRIRIPTDGRGFISSGRLKDGRPIKLDHWDITDFDEVVAAYGDQPKTIYIRFYSEEMGVVFEDEFVRWAKSKAAGSKGTKARTCTGCECVHRIDEEVHGQRYTAGEISECVCTEMADDDPMRCRYSAHLKAVIVHPDTHQPLQPIIYGFRTTSRNNGDAIYNELLKTRMLCGRITDIVFALNVKMCESKSDARKRFPLWELRAVSGGDRALAQGTAETMLPEAKPAELPQASSEPTEDTQSVSRANQLLTTFGELRERYQTLTGQDFNVPAILARKNVQSLEDLPVQSLKDLVKWSNDKVISAEVAGVGQRLEQIAADVAAEPAQETGLQTAEEIEERESLLELANDLWLFHKPGLPADWRIRMCLTITGDRTSDPRNLTIPELLALIEQLQMIKSHIGQEVQ